MTDGPCQICGHVGPLKDLDVERVGTVQVCASSTDCIGRWPQA